MFGVFWAILLHPKIIKFFQSDLGCSWIFHTAKESCTTTKTSFGPSVLRNTHIYIVIFSHFLCAKQVKHFFFVKKAIIKTKCSWNLNKLIFCPASSKWPFDYPQMEVTKRPRKGHLWVQTVTSHQRSRGSNEISRSCDVAVFFFEKSRSPEKKKMMRIWRSILSHIWSSKKRSRSQTRGFHTTEDRLGDATLLLLAALLDWPCWSIMPALVTWLSGLADSNLQTLNVHNLLTPWVI